ncbi:hypothetical protein V6R21_07990 [Limibacter armeniacum]|uniref:ArnT family glycosyltransferase n=1 Tax=Limibacter armeniacum TaxID=466084 RepID=UPI002FE6A0BE
MDTVYWKKPRVLYALLLLMMVGAYGSGMMVELYGNAVKYASISKELLERGDWLKLTFKGGLPYLQKPPLFFWLNALSMDILGQNSIAYRLPSLMFYGSIAYIN